MASLGATYVTLLIEGAVVIRPEKASISFETEPASPQVVRQKNMLY